MNKLITLVATALLIIGAGTAKAQDNVNIGKSNIKLNSRMMTPEALWAMGRIGGVAASPNGSQVVYQVGYYSVKQNKGHQVICIMNADGSQQRQLTTSSKSETDPVWLNAETIAFNCGGEIWTMKADGSDRQQLTKTGGKVEGFKFSPDGTKVILIQSMPFHEIIKKNPDDLPLATGRRVTDLMYRHWDHYVESIQHPFLAEVTAEGVGQGIDILEGEPFECPMEPFGGIEQLAWSPDSKTIAYTCRKKIGMEYATSTDSDIFLYNIGSRETRNLCKPADWKQPATDMTHTRTDQAVNADPNANTGYDQNPMFSPDGKYIAWQSMPRDGYESDLNRICVYSLETGTKQYVAHNSDIDAFCWAPAKDKTAMLYFISVWHGCKNMYRVDRKGVVSQLTDHWSDWTSLQLANDGKRILATRQSISAPTDIYMVTPGKNIEKTQVTQISQENKQILDQLTFGKVQQRWVKTTDNKEMLVWVILPANYEEGKK